MLVRQVMNRDVVVAKPDISLKHACEVMYNFHIGCLIISDDKKINGIVTNSDVIKAVANGREPDKTLIDTIMTKNVITVDPDKDIEDAAKLMTENKIKKLPVVDNDKLVGIITASDIVSLEPKLLDNLESLISMKMPGYSGG